MPKSALIVLIIEFQPDLVLIFYCSITDQSSIFYEILQLL